MKTYYFQNGAFDVVSTYHYCEKIHCCAKEVKDVFRGISVSRVNNKVIRKMQIFGQ